MLRDELDNRIESWLDSIESAANEESDGTAADNLTELLFDSPYLWLRQRLDERAAIIPFAVPRCTKGRWPRGLDAA